jgi:hypothetical protein
MNKTRNLKRTRLLKKTKKYFGGENKEKDDSKKKEDDSEKKEDDSEKKEDDAEKKEDDSEKKEKEEQDIPKKEGVIDIIENKATDFAKDTGNFLKDKTLRLFGLQPINKNENQPDKGVNKLEDTVSGLASNAKSIGNDVVKVFDEGSAAIIGNINDVLQSPKVEKSVTAAAEQTVKTGTKLLNIFNENLNNPRFKEETKEALDNIADYAKITVKALNEPLNEAIDEFSEAGNKAAAGVAAGLVKVTTDAAGAIPGYGAIIDVGKMINDGTRAASTVVEAASEASETASELFLKTTNGIKQGMKELEEKKNEAMNIANRTSSSINDFHSPALDLSKKLKKSSDKIKNGIPSVRGGSSGKSKKRLLKRKAKSKKVRFAL